MGRILCEKHGRQGIVLTCDHIWQDILTGISTIGCVVTGKLVVDFVEQPVAYCEDCAKQSGLPLHGGVLPDPEMDTDPIGKAVCSACFAVLKDL
ncbi:MAG: hypothetical protein V7638_5127 [Acidobacteriota bacterium]